MNRRCRGRPAGAENMRKPSASAREADRGRHAVRALAKQEGRKEAPARPSKAARKGGAPARAEGRRNGRSGAQRPPAEPAPPTRLTAVESGATSRGKYVYCIIEASDPLRFGPIGLGANPSEVYTVHFKTLAAVVSDAPLEVVDSTREHVLAHERVNETVMREHTVIPMSFGTIFKTREDIVELLRSAAEAFGDVLNKMQNKLEFGLKVLWDRDQAIGEVEGADEDIRRLKKEISGQKGPTYFARMQYGRLVDSALQARSERYVGNILEELRDVSVASRINKAIGDKR